MTEVNRPELNDRLLEAMRWPARIRMNAWADELARHRPHETFHVQSWPFSREYGFTCACSGTEQEWRIAVTSLREMLPEALESLQRLFRSPARGGGTKRHRKSHRLAQARAKALLHRYLTKEQRWELRATQAFHVRGQDGRTYLVTEGSANNVRLLEQGRPKYSLCVVPKGHEPLPIYDLMLAQKVLLETSVALFLQTAQVYNLDTKMIFGTGAFLLEGIEPPSQPPPPPLRVIDQADLDEPAAWVAARLQEATQGDADGDATDDGPAQAAAE